MKKDYAQKMMNPVNLRILQQIMFSGEIDTKRIAEAMPDIPISSLYRHLGELCEAGIVKVASQTPKRGALKKTYALNEGFTQENPSKEQLDSIMKSALCIIAGEMQQYFEHGYTDIGKDCVDLSNVIVNVDEEEFMEMRKEILEVFQKYMEKPQKETGKTRRITFISSPVIGKEDGNGKY